MSALIVDTELDNFSTMQPIGSPWPITADELLKMDALGIFDGGRVELLDGSIVKMSPINLNHANAFRSAEDVLRELYSSNYEIRTQLPIALSALSMPQPDIVVATGNRRNYTKHHPYPEEIALLIEVSDATLSTDQGFKAKLYAKAGIKEYWILNLVYSRLEVYRDPNQKAGVYRNITPYTPSQTVSPLFSDTHQILVADMLPPVFEV